MTTMKRIAAILILIAAPLCAQPPQAISLYEQERYEEAKKILAPMRDDPDALFLLGKIALQQDDDENAVSFLEKAAKLKPAKADIHYWLALADRSVMLRSSFLKQPSIARKMRAELERAIEIDPNHYDARIALIDYFIFAPAIAGGSEKNALAQAAEVKRRDRFAGHRAYARLYIRQKKLDLARKEYVDAVREEPSSAQARVALGAFYAMNEKNFAPAFTELDAALKLDPDYMPAWFRLGQAAAVSGTNLPRGEDALKKYLAYRPKDNEPGRVSAWYYLGSIYEKQGRKAEARTAYANALSINPRWKEAREAANRVK
jgi:tetratricopeptide (TPR) repeat protein